MHPLTTELARSGATLPLAAGSGPRAASPPGAALTRHRGLLARRVDALQAQGRYVLTDRDLGDLPISRVATTHALGRLVVSGRLSRVGRRRGLWLIVPPEYQTAGGPPAEWVLHDVMEALGVPYYLALRSAAAQFGATHHAVQTVQVVVGRRIEPLRLGRVQVRLTVRAGASAVPTVRLPGQVAPLLCSSPEATALDLVRYMGQAGGLSTVAGVLAQMRTRLTRHGMRSALGALDDTANAQRLGHLLDLVAAREAARACAAWLADRPHRAVALEHGAGASPSSGAARDERWKLIINAVPDLSL